MSIYNNEMASAIELNNQGVLALDANQVVTAQRLTNQAVSLMKGMLECCDALASWQLPTIRAESSFSASKKAQHERKDYDEGMDTFSRGMLLDASNATGGEILATILYNQGQCYARKNLETEAYMMFRASLVVLPSSDRHLHGSGLQQQLHELLLQNIGRIEFRLGRYNDAISTYTRALELIRRGPKKGTHQMLKLAACQNCLAVVHFHLPKADTDQALDHCHLALRMYRAALGQHAQSKEVATVINNIGRIHFLREEYPIALSVYREALSLRRRLFGNNNLDLAATVFNIAQTSHALRDCDKALAYYGEFLAIAKCHLGEQHRDVAATMKCMAEVYHDLQDYDKAQHLYKQALAIGKASQENCCQEIAGTLNKLGNLYYEQGDLEASLEAYTEELHIERATLGDCHVNVAITCTNIGQIYKRRNDYDRALTMYIQAIKIQRQTLLEPNADVAATLSSIAFIYSQTNRLDEAFNLYQEVLWIQREAIGENCLEMSSTLNSIGLVLFKMEQHELALESFYESLRIRKKSYGDHHDVAIVLYNIATVYLDQSDDEKALDYYLETLRVEQKSSPDGSNYKDVAVVLKHIGQVHQKNGDLEEATNYYHQALAQFIKAPEQDHLEISNVLILMGSAYLQYGHAEEVVRTCSSALRHFQLAGKNVEEFQLFGYNFYSLSKMHPNCAPVA